MTKEYCQDLEWRLATTQLLPITLKLQGFSDAEEPPPSSKIWLSNAIFPFPNASISVWRFLKRYWTTIVKFSLKNPVSMGTAQKFLFYSLIKSKQKVLKITFHILKEFDLRFGIEALLGFASKILTKKSLISSLIFLFQMAAHNGCILEKMSFAISRANVQCSRSTLVYARISSTPTWASTPRPNLTSQVVRD